LVVDQTGPEEQAFLNIPPNDRPDIADNDSAHTGSHRAVLRKRKLREQQGSPTPTPKGSKRQRLVDDGTWIDDGTLREFDRQTSMLIGEMKSKNQLILDWLNGVSTTGVKENLETNNNTLDMTMAIEGAL
jgi:hypothetical protein